MEARQRLPRNAPFPDLEITFRQGGVVRTKGKRKRRTLQPGFDPAATNSPVKRVLQLEGVVTSPPGNLLLQIALTMRGAHLDPEALTWTWPEGGNLAKIQILLRGADGHHSASLCQALRAVPEVAHVVACELKHAWNVPRLSTHVHFEGKDRAKSTETPDTPGPR